MGQKEKGSPGEVGSCPACPLELSVRGQGACEGPFELYFLSRKAASSPGLAGSLSPSEEACVPLILFLGRRGWNRVRNHGPPSCPPGLCLGPERLRVELMSVVFLRPCHAVETGWDEEVEFPEQVFIYLFSPRLTKQ